MNKKAGHSENSVRDWLDPLKSGCENEKTRNENLVEHDMEPPADGMLPRVVRPTTPKSDQHRFSPNDFNTFSREKVMKTLWILSIYFMRNHMQRRS